MAVEIVKEFHDTLYELRSVRNRILFTIFRFQSYQDGIHVTLWHSNNAIVKVVTVCVIL
jgi:hypothetical protein